MVPYSSVPDRVKTSFVIFDIQTLTLRAKRQSVQVSKITNDGLTGLARDAL